ncbi:MAG: tetratricopeptide repeat protein [Chloroflexi bacterium]|nr:tetratricopeptide repeat protein [Chloroflexota bacterium]
MVNSTNGDNKGTGFGKSSGDKLLMALAFLAFPIALAAFYLAMTRLDDTNVYEQGSLDSREAADVAARALDAAEHNNNTVGTILSFLEGGSALLGLILAASASFLVINIRDIRSDLEGQARATDEKVEARSKASEDKVETTRHRAESEMARLSQELETAVKNTNKQIEELTEITRNRIVELTTQITDQLETTRQKAENSFRVLSLQLLAEQQVRARNYDSAIQTLQEAIELDADNQTTNYLLGYLYTARRKFELALQHLTRALQVNPNFAPALAAMGLAQRRIGDQEKDPNIRNRYWAEAELNLLKALDIDKKMVDADGESYFGTLGGLYRRQNRNDDALRAYEHAVEATPNSSYPVGNLALLYKITGKEQDAINMFKRAKEIAEAILDDQPSDYWKRLDLAQTLLVLGHHETALRNYQDVIDREPPVTALKSGVSALETLATSPQSIPHIQDAIKLLEGEIARRDAEEGKSI